MADAQDLYTKFRTILLQFSKCHSLYDCSTTTPDMIRCLGKWLLYQLFNAYIWYITELLFCIDEAIKVFFATLDSTFGGIKRTVKMHLLEDHMVDWMSAHQAGCGLMGEQGAESIHAKFNSLARTYSGIKDRKLKLKNLDCSATASKKAKEIDEYMNIKSKWRHYIDIFSG